MIPVDLSGSDSESDPDASEYSLCAMRNSSMFYFTISIKSGGGVGLKEMVTSSC
jgi:hypothetical protein